MYSAIAANKRKTIFLLLAFFVFIVGISYVLGQAYSALYGSVYSSLSITISALVGSAVYALVSYFGASRLALSMNGAQEISKRDDPRLWRTVENLAITNGMPMPKVYIIDDPALNAFATGRDPRHAVVAATSGLLETLNDNELEGVIAHELGHIKNYDIRVGLIAFALVAVVGILSDMFLRFSFYGRAFSDDDNSPGSSGVTFVLSLIAMVLAPLVASMIQLAISRQREYLADATGAMTTRYPEGLASALEKIRDNGSVLRKQNASTAHFFFANPLSSRSLAGLFSTHPPIEDRIARLRGIGKKL